MVRAGPGTVNHTRPARHRRAARPRWPRARRRPGGTWRHGRQNGLLSAIRRRRPARVGVP